MSTPTPIDRWVARELAQLTGRYPLFDMSLQSGIHHYVLGGFWFAAALFAFWTMASVRRDTEQRTRLLTTLAGSLVAIGLALLARHLVAWLPPRQTPELFRLYPGYFEQNWSPNSFPSDSSTLYASIAAGLSSVNRGVGVALWAAVVFLVALPRMYVGGHYVSDVLAGIALGIAGFFIARIALEPTFIRRLEPVFNQSGALAALGNVVVFFLILQVSIEFRDGVWLRNSIHLLREAAAKWHAIR